MTTNDGGPLATATATDLQVLDAVRTAAKRPCPTRTSAHDAAMRPWRYDDLIGVLERFDVRAVLYRLMPTEWMEPWPWWGHNGLACYYTPELAALLRQIGSVPESYESMRNEFACRVSVIREMVAGVVAPKDKREPRDADVQRIGARREWVRRVLLGWLQKRRQERRPPPNVAAMLHKLVENCDESISRNTMVRDLTAMRDAGAIPAELLPPLPD